MSTTTNMTIFELVTEEALYLANLDYTEGQIVVTLENVRNRLRNILEVVNSARRTELTRSMGSMALRSTEEYRSTVASVISYLKELSTIADSQIDNETNTSKLDKIANTISYTFTHLNLVEDWHSTRQ